jgi:hypothetical protein
VSSERLLLVFAPVAAGFRRRGPGETSVPPSSIEFFYQSLLTLLLS